MRYITKLNAQPTSWLLVGVVVVVAGLLGYAVFGSMTW